MWHKEKSTSKKNILTTRQEHAINMAYNNKKNRCFRIDLC